jgi:diguanylate cyclase (GGDEF)-like protein
MPSWNDLVEELRGDFIRGSLQRLEEAERLLEILDRDQSDQAALRDLMRRFHAFSGSGSTYGFPGVTRIGEAAEREAFAHIREGHSPDATALSRWKNAVESLRRELTGGSVVAAGNELSAPPSRAHPAPFDILVVDHDEQMRRVLVRLLEDEGMAPRVAGSRAEAITALAKIPDGVITDIRLPDGSGYALVDHLRSLPQGDGPAVVVLSMMTGLLDRVEAIHCGADAYFEKPVDWQALMRRLHHLLERRRAEAGRVLSVEDDPDQASFLRAVLESAGYEVRICNDPRHFETELYSFRPDLVLMDIILPCYNGYDLVRYIRQDERYATLPVLFLSTEGQVQARIEGARAGGDEHLVKPVAPALLLWAVAARIERSRFLKSLLDRDGLTRLLTHTAFLERARSAVAQKRRNPHRSAAWVMIDLDDFKSINDRFGHPVGDRVLVSLSALLRRRLRQSDTIGRYGGEEFVVLIDDLPEEGAVRLVTRLLAEFAATEHTSAEGAFRATFSAGVAMLEASMDLDDWRQAADAALYAGKAAGRNRVVAASTRAVPRSSGLSVADGRTRG